MHDSRRRRLDDPLVERLDRRGEDPRDVELRAPDRRRDVGLDEVAIEAQVEDRAHPVVEVAEQWGERRPRLSSAVAEVLLPERVPARALCRSPPVPARLIAGATDVGGSQVPGRGVRARRLVRR
jgi:hypothetical protein